MSYIIVGRKKLQSTPSVGRATVQRAEQRLQVLISIHALRGEGDVFRTQNRLPQTISIHALRGEGDSMVGSAVAR